MGGPECRVHGGAVETEEVGPGLCGQLGPGREGPPPCSAVWPVPANEDGVGVMQAGVRLQKMDSREGHHSETTEETHCGVGGENGAPGGGGFGVQARENESWNGESVSGEKRRARFGRHPRRHTKRERGGCVGAGQEGEEGRERFFSR